MPQVYCDKSWNAPLCHGERGLHTVRETFSLKFPNAQKASYLKMVFMPNISCSFSRQLLDASFYYFHVSSHLIPNLISCESVSRPMDWAHSREKKIRKKGHGLDFLEKKIKKGILIFLRRESKK